jgi:Na+:H+ antiporter, NhaA family
MPIHRYLLSPIRELSETGRLAGILLLLATIFSLALSNVGPGPTYVQFWDLKLGPDFFQESLLHWINDGLMAVFFLLVGLEIKREVTEGELSNPRQALIPAMAAVGGVAAPALIYVLFNQSAGGRLEGWAIPTATDIAFSLGILSLLGDRVTFSLKVFLTVLAIIDDLVAILIIAFFYTQELHTSALLYAALVVGVLVTLQVLKVKSLVPYLLLGLVLWYFIFESGVHATLAGVILAMCIPSERVGGLEHTLHKPVSYGILPLFALANTAITLVPGSLQTLGSGLGLGIILGLAVGKAVGVSLFSLLTVRLKWAMLPEGVTWRQVVGLGFMAGVGFTMSIFISTLSFTDTPLLLDTAKLATLIGSVCSALIGVALLSRGPHLPAEEL